MCQEIIFIDTPYPSWSLIPINYPYFCLDDGTVKNTTYFPATKEGRHHSLSLTLLIGTGLLLMKLLL